MIYFFRLISLTLVLLLSNCTTPKELTSTDTALSATEESIQIPGKTQQITNLKPLTIQSNDILAIRIASMDAGAIAPFNISSSNQTNGTASDEYLVNSDGAIDFPTIGSISLKGLSIEGAKNKVLEVLAPYFSKAPNIKIQLTNFRVNVNGEVKSPGSFNINNDRLTVIEAITLAGYFTSYAKRDSILIIREQDGIRAFGYLNFNSADIFSSPYFYLRQNDVINVRFDKAKAQLDKNNK